MKRICNNLNLLKKYFVQGISLIFTVISAILLFIDRETLGINSNRKAVLTFIIIGVLVFVWAVIRTCCYKTIQVFQNGQAELNLRYDDLWKVAFQKRRFGKKDKPKIVVVGVNTTFDTIVDEDLSIRHPLVSANTLHGQWIKEMENHGVSAVEINQRIQQNLSQRKIEPSNKLNQMQKERGNLDCYEKGTIAVYKYNNTFFYLIALAEFDEKNKAQNTKHELIKTIEKLIEYYDDSGQGYDIYIPLLGTGMSRTDIASEEVLQILVSYFKIYKAKIHGKVNIIVYKKQRDTISLDI